MNLTKSANGIGRDPESERERFLPLGCPTPHFSVPINRETTLGALYFP